MSQSTAIVGAVYGGNRSFSIAVSGTVSAEQAIAIGGYCLVATVDMTICVGKTGSAAVNLSGISAQPASPNGLFYCLAGVEIPLDVSDANQVITAICASGTGTLFINGPMGQSARR